MYPHMPQVVDGDHASSLRSKRSTTQDLVTLVKTQAAQINLQSSQIQQQSGQIQALLALHEKPDTNVANTHTVVYNPPTVDEGDVDGGVSREVDSAGSEAHQCARSRMVPSGH